MVTIEKDFDALRENEIEAKAKQEMNILCDRIEYAESNGNYEQAERLSQRLLELQDGWY